MKKTALILFLLCANYLIAQNCGKWRWSVKTLTDAGGINLINQTPTQTTIGQILTDIPPQPLHTASPSDALLPRFNSEMQMVIFTANIKEVKHEADQDYHLVLEDPSSGQEMVAEIPSPDCPSFSGFPQLQNRFATLRNWVDNNVPNQSGDGDPMVNVQIQGIKFWDEPGHATGSPPNGREIHPVIDIIAANGSVVGNSGSQTSSTLPIVKDNIASGNQPSNTLSPKNTNTMNTTPLALLIFILLGSILGAAGQVVRIVVGIKKDRDAATPEKPFEQNNTQLLTSLMIAVIVGGVAGVLSGISAADPSKIDMTTVMAMITAGYAGTDFIEGFALSSPTPKPKS